MANITRIKAKDPNKPSDEKLSKKDKKKAVKAEKLAKTETVEAVEVKSETKLDKKTDKATKKAEKKAKKAGKKPFLLFRPFIALGHYLRDSWLEIRQVRWPNRKTTWKMVLAVFIYTALFVAFIMLLDALFTFLFNLLLA